MNWEEYTIRSATTEDTAAIRKAHAEIEAIAGESLDLPEVGDLALLEFFVVEKDGEVLGGLYLEKSIRLCFVGTSFEVTGALRSIQDEVLASSKAAGIRFVHCDVPKKFRTFHTITRHLTRSGFEPRPDLLDHMYDLR